jgi:hypothetical protein
MTMDSQYPRLVVESQLARKQLAQTFESEAASEFSLVNDLTLATALQKNAGKDETTSELWTLLKAFAFLQHFAKKLHTNTHPSVEAEYRNNYEKDFNN